MLAWVVRGAEVVDGSGRQGFRADVGIDAGGRIARVGGIDDSEMPDASRIIDGAGMAVAPGFIDVHSHSDLTLPSARRAESSLLQGITTEVAGSCGWSMAPLKDETGNGVVRRLLSGLCGLDRKAIKFAWHSFAEYAAHLGREGGIGVNLYPVLGQSLLRAHVVGLAKRPATPEEIAAMRAMLRQALADGCRGLSTGRSYLPGGNADTDEVVALCEELAPFDGIYTSHIKNEAAEMLDAVDEVIAIGRRAGVKVQVSHHKAIGPDNFGMVRQSLARIEAARAEGVDIHCDVYPYYFAQIYMLRDGFVGHWRTLLPETVMARLADPSARAGLRRRLSAATQGMLAKPENYLLMVVPGREELYGMSVKDAAAHEGKDAFDLCCDLLLAHRLDVRIAARMCEDDVRTVLAHPLCMVGTDAFAIDGQMPAHVPLHPRHYGTFPRVAGRYRREVGLFDLPTAVHKMTGMPAAKLGLGDRGIVAAGNWADLVVFDPATINDRATGDQPTLSPVGIRAVFVNGQLAMADGEHTGVRAGRTLLRG
jgi:N-acyl-D-amino-acid deacylase